MKDIEREVEEYEFRSFSSAPLSGEVVDFEFENLEGKSISQIEKERKIVPIEVRDRKQKNFDISPIVRHHRGMHDEEDREKEARVADEVAKRVAKIEEDAFKKGYEAGMEQGRQDVYDQTRASSDEKLITLAEMISDTLSTKEEILKQQKNQLYTLIKNLTKWIIMRELKDDGQYIERLLEKLILESQEKANLLIQVDQKHFEQMPEVLERVQAKLGHFTNVRVETDYDIQQTGIVIESKNGIINGDLEQFKSLDKIFESVGVLTDQETEDGRDGTE